MPYLTPTADAFLTVYASIGNSDDKLTQAEWSDFVRRVDALIRQNAMTIHGEWHSPSDAPWQNACWCFDVTAEVAADLRNELTVTRKCYQQDSIAWAFVPETEFI